MCNTSANGGGAGARHTRGDERGRVDAASDRHATTATAVRAARARAKRVRRMMGFSDAKGHHSLTVYTCDLHELSLTN
jgi:hypothetical protein